MDKTGQPPIAMSETKTEVSVKSAWNGDYPVAQLVLLPEKSGQQGMGYIGDPQTFAVVWAAFKPGESEPAIDFGENLILFVRNIQYYNRLLIGKIFLEQGVAEIMAMETLSARPIEEKVAIAMAVIFREGVTGVQTRNGVLQVTE
jgi:hypothetical protein